MIKFFQNRKDGYNMKIIIILNDTLNKMNKSQYWLAKETGIAASTINNLCNNKTTRIDFNTIELICNVLNCELSDIFQLKHNE